MSLSKKHLSQIQAIVSDVKSMVAEDMEPSSEHEAQAILNALKKEVDKIKVDQIYFGDIEE